jgi:hypothetical protein
VKKLKRTHVTNLSNQNPKNTPSQGGGDLKEANKPNRSANTGVDQTSTKPCWSEQEQLERLADIALDIFFQTEGKL